MGTPDDTSTARRMWQWPVAILVSFPIGGLIADLVVDGVDSVGAALAGGLIVGAIIGAPEWFALRQRVSWLWIPATAAGMAVGLVAGAAVVDYGTSGLRRTAWLPLVSRRPGSRRRVDQKSER